MMDRFCLYLDALNVKYDKLLIEHGWHVLKEYILFMFLLLIPICIFHLYRECVVFLILYFPLRGKIGGLHFKQKRTCFVMSVCFNLIACVMIKTSFFPHSYVLFLMMFFFLQMYIQKYGCMDCKEKRFNAKEKEYFRKKGHHIVCLYCIVGLFSLYFKIEILYQTVYLLFLFSLLSFFIFSRIKP